MTDLGTTEKRKMYLIPVGEGFFEPYVGSEPWSGGTVTVDGDMMPVEQRAISWCTTHSSSGQGPSPRGVACHYSALRQATKLRDRLSGLDILEPCEFSTGRPEHKWWVDV